MVHQNSWVDNEGWGCFDEKTEKETIASGCPLFLVPERENRLGRADGTRNCTRRNGGAGWPPPPPYHTR